MSLDHVMKNIVKARGFRETFPISKAVAQPGSLLIESYHPCGHEITVVGSKFITSLPRWSKPIELRTACSYFTDSLAWSEPEVDSDKLNSVTLWVKAQVLGELDLRAWIGFAVSSMGSKIRVQDGKGDAPPGILSKDEARTLSDAMCLGKYSLVSDWGQRQFEVAEALCLRYLGDGVSISLPGSLADVDSVKSSFTHLVECDDISVKVIRIPSMRELEFVFPSDKAILASTWRKTVEDVFGQEAALVMRPRGCESSYCVVGREADSGIMRCLPCGCGIMTKAQVKR